MTIPGPTQLGRSVVLGLQAPVPPHWADHDEVHIDRAVIADPVRLSTLIHHMQVRYVKRQPTVYRLDPDVHLAVDESNDDPPYRLGGRFTFLEERMLKALWHNSYDLRGGEPVWWWAHKAVRAGAEVGGHADVTLPDGRVAWIDGGPRQPLDVDETVIHHETIETGRLNPIRTMPEPSSDLASDQIDAVTHVVGPARIIAPAGSGKTRVLTARIRHLLDDRHIEPQLVTALAYNRRAAREMADRLPDRRLNIRTIHSLGWEILREAKPHLRLIDEREQRRRLDPIAPAPPRPNTDVIGPYIEALTEVRIGLRDPEKVEAERDDVPGFTDTFRAYRDRLEQEGEADHDEQIYGAIEALCRDPKLRARWQGQCRHLLVDEFQDLTPAYLLLIRLVASPALNVFGVGDDDQVIYGYVGADPAYLISFDDLFPGAGAHALEVNYRCPQDVVEGAANLLEYNRYRVEKKIRAHSPVKGLRIIRKEGDALTSAAMEHIDELVGSGNQPASIAILARVNSALLPIHVALAGTDLPFQSPLSPTVLERTVLRAALAWMRIAVDPAAIARNDLFEAIRRPSRGLTGLTGELVGSSRGPFSINDLVRLGSRLDERRRRRWKEFIDDLATAAANTHSTPKLVRTLISDIGLDRAAAALDAGRDRADRAAQSDVLVALCRAAVLGPDPASFETWLRDRLAVPTAPEGLVLSTVHRVKGLEWDHVVVFGADSDAMPHHLSDDHEEERRVFHVAMTRGRKSVTILADRSRPSIFLEEVAGTAIAPPPAKPSIAASPPIDGVKVQIGDRVVLSGGYQGTVKEVLTTGVIVETTTGAAISVAWGERVQTSEASGKVVPPEREASPDLLARLKSWRTEQARTQGVPAYVVFSDKTLEALALASPSSEVDLLAVPGIGPAKLEAYGDQLLELLATD